MIIRIWYANHFTLTGILFLTWTFITVEIFMCRWQDLERLKIFEFSLHFIQWSLQLNLNLLITAIIWELQHYSSCLIIWKRYGFIQFKGKGLLKFTEIDNSGINVVGRNDQHQSLPSFSSWTWNVEVEYIHEVLSDNNFGNCYIWQIFLLQASHKVHKLGE